MPFTHYKAVTIDHLQCGVGNSSDFPVTIAVTDADYATIANGGKAANASGFDIRPYADQALSSALTFELVSYNATTGAIELHVKIPTLSVSVDVTFYLAVGDAALSSDGSSSSAWDSSFKGVYHLGDGLSLSLVDSSGNSNALTKTGSVTVITPL